MDSLVAGALAGLVVDVSLYPIDTIKTRMQSKEGFWKSGGLRKIYRGLSAVAVGSIPGGAAFFFFYDVTKSKLLKLREQQDSARSSLGVVVIQATAAAAGECAACCIRVPTEMVKQQLQAGKHSSPITALHCITHSKTLEQDSVMLSHRPINWWGLHHLFRGMPIMLARELPFSMIQMSLYEGFKRYLDNHNNSSSNFQYVSLVPFCAAAAGGIAAFLTTPLDVIKTRVMLQNHQHSHRISQIIKEVLLEEKRPSDKFGVLQKFFRGATARVFWISLGGSIFLSTYELGRWSASSFFH